jgi:multidrug efflux pump subunit AcrB
VDVTNSGRSQRCVTINQPGSYATEIETRSPSVGALRSISGVNSIQSTAGEGSSFTFVEFEIGTNLIEAGERVGDRG